MTTLKPVGNRVVIEPVAAEETTAGGLVIPDSAKQTPQEAVVIAVGSDVKENLKVGDKVIYSLYGGVKVSFSGHNYLVMETADIIAVIENG